MVEETKTESSSERSELFILLQNFSNLRTGQDQVLWSIIGSFWTANSLLLVSIFATDQQDRTFVGILISFVGISISWIWNHIQSSALKRIESYEHSIKSIERKLKLEFDHCSFLRADSEYYEKKVNKNSARYVMKKFSFYAIIVWAVSILLFGVLLIFEIFCNQ